MSWPLNRGKTAQFFTVILWVESSGRIDKSAICLDQPDLNLIWGPGEVSQASAEVFRPERSC